jgi:hypothetical protein
MLIKDGWIQYESGAKVPLRPDIVDIVVDGDIHILKFPAPFGMECVSAETNAAGRSVWWIIRLPNSDCILDKRGDVLTLPEGIYRSMSPMRQVLQVGSLFVVSTYNPEERISKPLICMDVKGQVRWELPAKAGYYGIWYVGNPGTFIASRDVVIDTIDVASGVILKTALDR